MEIFEDARVVSRADLAAWLRQLANQLESGQIFYGAAGTVEVADQVHCELEIERENGSEMSVEIEFTWASPAAAESPGASGERDTTDGEDDEETKEEEETTEAQKAGTAVAEVAGDGGGEMTAKRASSAEDTAGSGAAPTQQA